MALTYGDVSKFARENGNVTAWAEKGKVTILASGQQDTVAFFETDAVQFEHKGKSYTREQFEALVKPTIQGGGLAALSGGTKETMATDKKIEGGLEALAGFPKPKQ
jgi:hypothetical protein